MEIGYIALNSVNSTLGPSQSNFLLFLVFLMTFQVTQLQRDELRIHRYKPELNQIPNKEVTGRFTICAQPIAGRTTGHGVVRPAHVGLSTPGTDTACIQLME